MTLDCISDKTQVVHFLKLTIWHQEISCSILSAGRWVSSSFKWCLIQDIVTFWQFKSKDSETEILLGSISTDAPPEVAFLHSSFTQDANVSLRKSVPIHAAYSLN